MDLLNAQLVIAFLVGFVVGGTFMNLAWRYDEMRKRKGG